MKNVLLTIGLLLFIGLPCIGTTGESHSPLSYPTSTTPTSNVSPSNVGPDSSDSSLSLGSIKGLFNTLPLTDTQTAESSLSSLAAQLPNQPSFKAKVAVAIALFITASMVTVGALFLSGEINGAYCCPEKETSNCPDILRGATMRCCYQAGVNSTQTCRAVGNHQRCSAYETPICPTGKPAQAWGVPDASAVFGGVITAFGGLALAVPCAISFSWLAQLIRR